MNELLQKLNTLLKANINALRGESRPDMAKADDSGQLSKNIDREVKALRRKVKDAQAYEDKLLARVQQLASEVKKWDDEADKAVAAGDDVAARMAITKMQVAQQRLDVANSDMTVHQHAAQELIEQVNMLEAAVADAKHQAKQAAEESEQPQVGGTSVGDFLRETRDKISAAMQQVSTAEETVQQDVDSSLEVERRPSRSLEDDLSERRLRLSSKPKDDNQSTG